MSGDPATIGPYTVRRLLGRGATGRVYLATAPDGGPVAVKVIRAELAADARFRVRFRREIDAARRLPPRCTAPVLAADPDAAQPWVATTYVDGPSLDGYVREHGPLRGRALRRLATGLLRALVALAAAGLVHRDLKPSNILLGRDGPRLVDFGIARAADDTRLTATGAMLGTPAYMAPEQALGDADVGPAADVHALGGVLVFAATGAPPFPGPTPAAVLYRRLHGEPDLGATPEPVRGWASRCLARDPSARPDATRLLAEARRRPLRWAVPAAVTVVVLALGAAYLAVPGPTAGSSTVPALHVSVPGNGPAAVTAPAAPATVAGPVVALGHRAGRVAASAGRVWVADQDAGGVTALDPLGRTVGRVDVGRFPSALAVSPDGTRLYVTLNTGRTRLLAVDTATLRVVDAVDLAAPTQAAVAGADLAVSDDGRTVVVLDPRTSRVVALDAASLSTVADRAFPGIPIAMDVIPDGRLLVLSAPDDTGRRLTVVTLPSLAPVTELPAEAEAPDVAVDRDGTRAYLATSVTAGPAGLRVLDVAGGRVRAVVDDVAAADRLVAAPGGRWVYVLQPGTDAGLVALDAGGPRVAARVPVRDAEDVAVSPDGRAVYVVQDRNLRIFTTPG